MWAAELGPVVVDDCSDVGVHQVARLAYPTIDVWRRRCRGARRRDAGSREGSCPRRCGRPRCGSPPAPSTSSPGCRPVPGALHGSCWAPRSAPARPRAPGRRGTVRGAGGLASAVGDARDLGGDQGLEVEPGVEHLLVGRPTEVEVDAAVRARRAGVDRSNVRPPPGPRRMEIRPWISSRRSPSRSSSPRLTEYCVSMSVSGGSRTPTRRSAEMMSRTIAAATSSEAFGGATFAAAFASRTGRRLPPAL